MISVSIDGVSNLKELIAVESKNTSRALLNAIKVEGFSLRQTIRQSILLGKPAPGAHLQDLSIIARVINRKSIGGGIRQPLPLKQLAGGVTYDVDQTSMTMKIGFTRRSPLWVIRAAIRQQAGFTRPITNKMRAYFAAKGAEIRENRTWRGRRKGNPLMLRKETTQFVVPPRPIIEPFWNYQKNSSVERIRENFRAIMSGAIAKGGVINDVREMAGW